MDDVRRKYSKMKALEHFSQVEADKGNDKKAIELMEAAAEIQRELE